jgi:hypothetical protein
MKDTFKTKIAFVLVLVNLLPAITLLKHHRDLITATVEIVLVN